jgi:hypothetical protein
LTSLPSSSSSPSTAPLDLSLTALCEAVAEQWCKWSLTDQCADPISLPGLEGSDISMSIMESLRWMQMIFSSLPHGSKGTSKI